jgi:hypothetical protein
VRLAGGNSQIVLKVLSNPHRSSVDLRTAIKEIEALRNSQKMSAAPSPSISQAAPA